MSVSSISPTTQTITLQHSISNPLQAFIQKIASFAKTFFEHHFTTYAAQCERDPAFLRHIQWTPRSLSPETALDKMRKNAQKALLEHRKHDPVGYVEPADLSALQTPSAPITLQYFEKEAQGRRWSMEDAHFFMENNQGALVGVFDGHGGNKVAKHASQYFQNHFMQLLQQNQGNVHQTFEQISDTLQKQILADKRWEYIGSTAVLSYIDKRTRQVFTATLGDSEANIYRNVRGACKSIPLSCVRDWSSKNDARRIAYIRNDSRIARDWPLANEPKHLRHAGVNVSRGFGDAYTNRHEPQNPGFFYKLGMKLGIQPKIQDKPGSLHKPKITVSQLQQGDTLVLACDGLKDFVPEREICQIASTARDPAESLVDHALRTSTDNVTVLAIRVF